MLSLIVHLIIALLLVIPALVLTIQICRRQGFSLVGLLLAPLPATLFLLLWKFGG